MPPRLGTLEALMRKFLLVTASAVALTAPAFGADMSSPQPMAYTKAPMVAPAFTWTGLYLGGHGGYGWGRIRSIDPTGLTPDSTVDTKGGLAGGQIGYLYQMGPWVLGVEGTMAWSDVKFNSVGPFGIGTINVKNDYIGTVAGRAGYAFDRALLYGKGGVAFTRDVLAATDGLGGTSSGTFNRTGYVVGGGVEYAFWDRWSARVEYNFLDFGTKLETPGATGGMVVIPSNIKNNISTVTFGVNYHLN
jgi:outer membrane immunogenic protein